MVVAVVLMVMTENISVNSTYKQRILGSTILDMSFLYMSSALHMLRTATMGAIEKWKRFLNYKSGVHTRQWKHQKTPQV